MGRAPKAPGVKPASRGEVREPKSPSPRRSVLTSFDCTETFLSCSDKAGPIECVMEPYTSSALALSSGDN
jgi:hypothetical protein